MDSQQNVAGLAVVADFHAYQFDAIISAIEHAQIPYQPEFFFYISDAFRLFVSPATLEKARDITQGIENGRCVYDESIALAKYNSRKNQAVTNISQATDTSTTI
jgi:hypothetical protein